MATHSSTLAWRIPGTGEPGGLPSMGSHRVGHDLSDLVVVVVVVVHTHTHKIHILEFNLCQLHALQIFSLICSMYFHFFMKSSDEAAAAAAKSLQSCPTLCDPIDGRLPDSSIHGIFQARELEWGAIAFSIFTLYSILLCTLRDFTLTTTPCDYCCHFIDENLMFKCVSCSVVTDSLWPHGLQPSRLLCPWNFPGKNTGVGKPFPTPGDLPNPGIQLGSHALQADSLPSEPPEVYFEDLRAGILHHSSLCHQHVS